MNYSEFLRNKSHSDVYAGFDPLWLPDFLFDFQKHLCDWAIRKGKAALFCDCGMGKTPMQLVWARNVVQKTNKSVLIVTPLAVGAQTVREGEKFGIECHRSHDGKIAGQITITNYERLHLFDANDFIGVVCDESSILKNFDGVRRAIVTEFLRTRPYRLLCTATAAPNDYTELGTSSEALGELGLMDMLNRFFKNQNNTIDMRGHWRGFAAPREYEMKQWRFKRHAEVPFWRWVCSWARALRRPSDLGYDDGEFILPELIEREHVVENANRLPEMLFVMPAISLQEQRAERRVTIQRRCEEVANLVNHKAQSISWCHLNDEGDLLEQIIPDAVQVSGKDSDERKEEIFMGFVAGQIRVMIIKPKIGAWGLNFQNCAHETFFPSHSFEQYYQGVRRCWRFGQIKPVVVDVVTTTGEMRVLKNLQRKAEAADKMFSELVKHMDDVLHIKKDNEYLHREVVPAWL